jgi:hypothetical protein
MSAILSLYDFKTLKDIITTFINKIKEITMDVKKKETAIEHINHLLDNLKCQSGKASAA